MPTDKELDARHNARELVVYRACRLMGWEEKQRPAFGGVRAVAEGLAVAISVEKLNELLDRLSTTILPGNTSEGRLFRDDRADQADIDELRGLLDAMANFPSNDQRARYLLTSNWMQKRGAALRMGAIREAARHVQGLPTNGWLTPDTKKWIAGSLNELAESPVNGESYSRVECSQPDDLVLHTDREGTSWRTAQAVSGLTHSMNCPALTPASDDDCTCGLEWRIALVTEQTMHAAWRKRAEEAEAEIERLREEAEATWMDTTANKVMPRMTCDHQGVVNGEGYSCEECDPVLRKMRKAP